MQQIFSRLGRTALLSIAALPLLAACHGGRHHNLSESEIAERLEDVAEYGLDRVDADEQQTARVNQTLRGLAPDLVRFRTEQRALAAQLRTALAQEPVDRARIEQLRRQMLDLFDRASARGSQALVATAEVLSVDQRKQLVESWEKHSH
jgi:hypothetical protein